MRVPPLAWIVASVLCSSLAHFALKIGAGRLSLGSTLAETAVRLAGNGWLIGGASLHVLALGLWVMGLRSVELSVAYPFISLGLALVALLSWLFLHEALGAQRIAGVALVAAGVVLIARS